MCSEFDANLHNEEKLKAMNCDKSTAVWQQQQEQQQQEPPAVCQQPLLLLSSRLYHTRGVQCCVADSVTLVSVQCEQCAAQASPAVQEGTLDYPWQQGTSDNQRHLHT